jgi:cardiolipin synthase
MIDWSLAYLGSEWAIRLVMLVYVPQRRTPAGARTWLLLIFLLPWPGLVLYALFGRIYVPRRRIDLQEKASAMIRALQDQVIQQPPWQPGDHRPGLRQAVRLAESLGDFKLCAGNSFELLPGYAASIDRLVADIEAARHHVHLLYYIFAGDATGNRVADALARAEGRGVRCRVLMDALGSGRAVRSLVPRMRAAGIDVKVLLPVRLPWRRSARADLRNHRKIAVIDGRIGYVGSQNLVDPEFVKGHPNEELVARVLGPVVGQLQVVFLADRFFETEERIPDPAHFPEPVQGGSSPAQVLPSGPSYQRANVQELFVALIHGAKDRVVITTPYFVPDAPFLQAMRTAVLRGVAVDLVVSRPSNQWLTHLAQQSFYEDLLEAGVAIHLYRPRFLHAKHVSVDDAVAVIGSSNIDIRSFDLNAEVSMLVYDPAVVEKLRAVEERNIADSETVSLEAWRQRPLRARILENTARLADSFL